MSGCIGALEERFEEKKIWIAEIEDRIEELDY